ncbi:hypothetical protein PUN4_180073 [Paraburkholderia unamae]|nr:hypothetical protein PUN4_180073 [Paraburkholderia unamae]
MSSDSTGPGDTNGYRSTTGRIWITFGGSLRTGCGLAHDRLNMVLGGMTPKRRLAIVAWFLRLNPVENAGLPH